MLKSTHKVIVPVLFVLGASLTMNIHQHGESSPKDKEMMETDKQYYKGLQNLSDPKKKSKSELPSENIESFGEGSSSHLEKNGSANPLDINAGSAKFAQSLIETSNSESQTSQVEASQKLAKTLFDYGSCMGNLPKIQYMAYEAASFCRVYLYSCNNLWPEELNTEVTEGTFCFINSVEALLKTPITKTMAAFNQQIVAPWFLFAMEFWSYTDKKTMKDMDKALMDATSKEAFVELPVADSLCQEKSEELRLKCMMQTMKNRMSEVGSAKPDLSRLSTKQMLRLITAVQNTTTTMAVLEEAKRLLTRPDWKFKSMTHQSVSLHDHGGDDMEPIPGPLKTTLGTLSYKNSAPFGFVGPVSPNYRWPQDVIQGGLEMQKFELTKMHDKALCNDGTPAVLYMKLDSMTKWHFHIDGGFFCYDALTCMQRAHASQPLVSSMGFEDKKNNSGMFDPTLGGFPGYTHALGSYCSSDAWMGQVEIEDFQMVEGTTMSSGKPGSFFYGYFITEAILKAFVENGMGDTPGQELWVSGCSAGAIASTAMADSWQSRLKALGMKNDVKVWTMLDNMPIVSPTAMKAVKGKSIHEMAMTLVGLIYGPGRDASPSIFLNKDCLADYGDTPGECVWPGTVIKYIKIPNIILVQLWDNFVTAKTYGFMHPMRAPQYNTGVEIVNMTKDKFKDVTPTQNFWSISCGDHCMSENPNWWRSYPNTGTQKSARDLTLETRDGALGQVVTDECFHYNCGCIGQSSSYTKLAMESLLFEVMERLAPGMSPIKDQPVTIGFTTSLAANQRAGNLLDGP